MSKIKDELQHTNEKKFEDYVSFMEWVCDQQPEVSDDANEMEENSQESSTKAPSIVHQNTLKAVNNSDYNPKLGA